MPNPCDGCNQIILGWEDEPEELEVCPDCGYSVCESCAVSSSRGRCRCVGSNFGTFSNGRPTKVSTQCVCMRCSRPPADAEDEADKNGLVWAGPQAGFLSRTDFRAHDEARRLAGVDLNSSDNVAFMFVGPSGEGVIRIGQSQKMTCKCLATRRLEHTAFGCGFPWATVEAENRVELGCMFWFRPVDASRGVYSNEHDYTDVNSKYTLANMLGIVRLTYDQHTRLNMIDSALDTPSQLERLRVRGRSVPHAAWYRASAEVDLSGELTLEPSAVSVAALSSGAAPTAGAAPSRQIVTFAVGAVVRLHSLISRPELNGKRAVVTVPLNAETGRVGVQVVLDKVDAQEKSLALKPANLEGW